MQATLPNTVINYDRIGSSNVDQPVLLFVHEALGSIGQWKGFPEKLCSQLKLSGIVYERQGHGESGALTTTRKADYLHQYALIELPLFLESIEETRPLVLIGHSDGGTIALLFASAYPKRVKAIVTMAAHVINERETIQGIAPAVAAYKAGKLRGLQKYHGDKSETLFFAWATIWRSESFLTWDITSEIGDCDAAALFIQGADDQYGTSKQLTLLASSYKGVSAERILENCGHHPHLEQEAEVLEIIEDFFSTEE